MSCIKIVGRKLIIDGMKYIRFRPGQGGKMYWNCTRVRRKGCKARAITMQRGNEIILLKGGKESDHQHPINVEEIGEECQNHTSVEHLETLPLKMSFVKQSVPVVDPPKIFDKEKDLWNCISEVSKVIRQKHRKLKMDKDTTEQSVEEFFRPVINPLKKIVTDNDTALRIKEEFLNDRDNNLQVKEEILNEKDDTMNDTFTSAMDIDEKPLLNSIEPYSAKKEHHVLNNPEMNEYISDEEEEYPIFNNDQEKSEINKSVDNKEEYSVDTRTLVEKELNKTEEDTLNKTGELIEQYLKKADAKNKEFDTKTGIRKLQRGRFLGDKNITFKNDYIVVGNESYKATKGLKELLFKKNPNHEYIKASDQEVYQKILTEANAYKKNYDHDKSIREEKTKKFHNIINPLIIGKGLLTNYMPDQGQKIDYMECDDPNILVDRLRFLMGALAAGNTHHTNEILSIIEELRDSEIID